MNKDYLFPVSIEKFAAFLDGNLGEFEMAEVQSLISNSEALQEISAVESLVSESAQSFSNDSVIQIPEVSNDFEIPEIPLNGMMKDNWDENIILEPDTIMDIETELPNIESIIDNNFPEEYSDGVNIDE